MSLSPRLSAQPDSGPQQQLSSSHGGSVDDDDGDPRATPLLERSVSSSGAASPLGGGGGGGSGSYQAPPPLPQAPLWRRLGQQLTDNASSLLSVRIALLSAVVVLMLVVLASAFIQDSFVQRAVLDLFEAIEDLDPKIGVPVLVLLYIGAMIVSLPGTPFNLAAGLLFGLWTGLAASMLGAVLGAAVAFVLSRHLLRNWVSDWASNNAMLANLDRAVAKQGFKLVLLCRLSPIFPYPLLSYFFGVTCVPLPDFIVASALGILPGSFLYCWIGTSLRSVAEVFSTSATSSSSDDDDDSSSQLLTLFWLFVAIAATVLTVVVVYWMTRKAIRDATAEAEAAGVSQPLEDVESR